MGQLKEVLLFYLSFHFVFLFVLKMEDSSGESKIKLHFCHDKVFVWDYKDAIVLRESYRVIGTCFGCYQLKPRQNVQLSLPILLSNIEAKFVLEHQPCVFLDSTALSETVNFEEYREETDEKRKIQHDIQTRLKQEQKWHDLDDMAEKISKGKQKKLLKKKTLPNSVDITTGDLADHVQSKIELESLGSSNTNFNISDFEEFKKTELKKIERFGFEQTWVDMHIKSDINEAYPLLKASDIQLTPEEKLKYDVFCHLHNQGYYLTDGLKFGGHFLVYPGDPGLYHSVYIVFCVPFTNKVCLADYSALGRLATSVKKTLLLCSVNDSGNVVYSSLAWSGFV